MEWTDEKVEKLQKLWAEGLSASKIANSLGDVSRNAVIGKVYRLKLSSQGRAASASTPRQKKIEQEKSCHSEIKKTTHVELKELRKTSNLQKQIEVKSAIKQHNVPSPDGEIEPVSCKLDLVSLTERTCKWPNGDPLNKDFSFCGNDITESGPYCSYHAKIAFQNVSERRRNR